MAVAIAIIVIILVGLISVVLLANRSWSTTGALSRETRKRDSQSGAEAGTTTTTTTSTSTELEATGRERSDETQETMGGAVAKRSGTGVARWEPVDEEELGVTRRQFLNRATLTVVGFAGIGALAPALLAFLWPSGTGGFGGKINVGSLSDIFAEIDEKNAPKYLPEARAYVQRYPKSALPNAKKVYDAIVLAGMEEGLVALYQKCPHLGCRVPWCQSSQWFECPCHGSKYNRVGEKKAGPAPRGMDRFGVEVAGDNLTINTGLIQLGPPIGTNTTGQQQEGPLCV